MLNINIEEIKRSAQGAADRAVKKTNELTNFAKLNVNIKSGEAKLNAAFEEIGRLFYTAERTGIDYTTDIASAIMKADKIKADIEKSKKALAALRNLTICPACGNEISNDAAFCSFCGAKQEKECCCCEEESEECGCCCEECCEEEECTCDCCCEEEKTDECTCCCEEEKAEECTCDCCDDADKAE